MNPVIGALIVCAIVLIPVAIMCIKPWEENLWAKARQVENVSNEVDNIEDISDVEFDTEDGAVDSTNEEITVRKTRRGKVVTSAA